MHKTGLLILFLILTAGCTRNYVKNEALTTGFKAFVFVDTGDETLNGSADFAVGNGICRIRIFDNLMGQHVLDAEAENSRISLFLIRDKLMYTRENNPFAAMLTKDFPLLFQPVGDVEALKKTIGTNQFSLENNWVKDILYRSSPEETVMEVLKRKDGGLPSRIAFRAGTRKAVFDITAYQPLDFTINPKGFTKSEGWAGSGFEGVFLDWWGESNAER